MDKRRINTTALAYLGDSVYEVFVRKHVMEENPDNVDALHNKAINFVRAEGQALAIKTLVKDNDVFALTEEEKALVKRARNRKIASKPKNTDPVIYKWATAFESLIGYLYIAEEKDRLRELVEAAIGIIENGVIERR